MANRFRVTLIPVVAAALTLTACSAGGVSHPTASAVKGGTLTVAGQNDVISLDPAGAYQSAEFFIHRAITRALFANVSTDASGGQKLVPDLAVDMPSADNGGISADGLTYTIKIRTNVKFHTAGGTQPVVAGDIVRGLKRMCNPVAPSPALAYFTSTIDGLSRYCDAFAKVASTVDAIKSFINSNEVSGISAPDNQTVKFKLIKPASDFVSILGLGVFASPQPASYLDSLPDSPDFRKNMGATGPYMIQAYTPNQSYLLVRNPDWNAADDPVRAANVDRIDVKLGQDPAAVQQQLEAGTIDMAWPDTPVPTASVNTLRAAKDPRLVIAQTGYIRPYVVINTVSPNANGAMKNVKVRQALNIATNKTAIQKILGGEAMASITNQVLPPQVPGYKQINPLNATPAGDAARAKQMLSDAGYPNGVPVTLLFRNDQNWPDMAAALNQSLSAAGFQVTLRQVPKADFYTKHLQSIEGTANGEWDIALAGWGPDYYGGRSYLVPMLDGRTYGKGSVNFGAYNDASFNQEIDAALAATDPNSANDHWAKADTIASTQAAWIPVTTMATAVFRSSRVRGFSFLTWLGQGDPTAVSLSS